MPNILTDADKAKIEQLPTLYSVTGDVKDANTLLVPRSILRALPAQLEQEAVYWECRGWDSEAGRWLPWGRVEGHAKYPLDVRLADLRAEIAKGRRWELRALYASPTPAAPAAPERGNTRCNPHPDAPHGFVRNASHNEGRYVCECEGWMPPAAAAPAAPAGMAVPEGWKLVPMPNQFDGDDPRSDALDNLYLRAMAAFDKAVPANQHGHMEWCERFAAALQALSASPSAQAAPARGAMTAGDCKIPARFTTNLSIDPLNLREHGINGWFDGQRYWSHDMADHWSAREIVLFELRAHGIGTTAPAGGEG